MMKKRSSVSKLLLLPIVSLILCLIHALLVLSCNILERDALLDLKSHLLDRRDRLSSWSTDSFSCCDWVGVGCDSISGDVLRLDLRNRNDSDPDNSLFGNLSTSVSRLRRLRYLDLSLNNFQSVPIPAFLASLRDLEYLNLSSAQFTGPIPPQFVNFSALRSLDLAGVFIEAGDRTVNFSMLASFPFLKLLRLSDCSISVIPHSLPKATSFPCLTYLDISINNFNSSLPPWLFNIKNLEYLSLYSNDFKGPIPASIEKMASLQSLFLSSNVNVLSFGLPREFSSLCNLTALHLDFINLIGFELNDFRAALQGCIMERLEILDFSHSSLSGHFPDWFGAFKKLKILNLFSNSLYGSLPHSIGEIASLQELNLGSNLLNGSIPASLGQLSNLTYLSLGQNSLSCVLSKAHFEKLSSLKTLDISSNAFVVDLGADWIPPFQLEYISLRNCTLGPRFPRWLQWQKNYTFLNLANTGISDSLPDWFWSLSSKFTYLDLSNNQIRGTVPSIPLAPADYIFIDLSFNHFEGSLPVFPTTIKRLRLSNNLFSGVIPSNIGDAMPALELLTLSTNHLTGSIPFSLCRAVELRFIDLSSNSLSGEIPDCWNATMLQGLDFANNSFSGGIPASLCSEGSIQSLHLSRNSLSGALPSSLMNCSYLVTLDLGHNNFAGEVPVWVGEGMQQLKALSLRSNNLVGVIPPRLLQLPYLQILDLSNNMLTGEIPRSFDSLAGMKTAKIFGEPLISSYINIEDSMSLFINGEERYYEELMALQILMDLSSNRLSGSIPAELGDLIGLQSLNLSGNHLQGSIIRNIGNLQQLEFLDLSRNRLQGEIPLSLAALPHLSVLNLSYNYLSGRIPKGDQLQSLDDPSIYMENLDLCGFPLERQCDGERPPPGTSSSEMVGGEDEEGIDEEASTFVSIAVGFVFGFWAFVGAIVFNKKWGDRYFSCIDEAYDNSHHFLLKWKRILCS